MISEISLKNPIVLCLSMKYRAVAVLALFFFIFGCISSQNPVLVNSSSSFSSNQENNQSLTLNVTVIMNSSTNITVNESEYTVVYYYSSKCSACKEIAPLYAEIKGNFSKYAKFKEYDIVEKNGQVAFGKFVSGHNITKAYVPTIIIGEKVLVGLDGMKRENLYYAMFEYLKLNEIDFEKQK